MSGPATLGWCPGALRPMESGDGLILRVKPRGGRMTLGQAEAIAHLALRFGNGHLDLTTRANLQIRGARPDTLEPLTRGLRETGLLDADAEVEALRNIVASPLAGHDPGCFDIRPFCDALERSLAAAAPDDTIAPTPSLRGDAAAAAIQPGAGVLDGFASLAVTAQPSRLALPAKWSFIIDGGGRLPLAGVAADMRFRFDGAGRLRIGLGPEWSEPVGMDLDISRLLNAAARLVAAQPKPMRMEALLARLGPAAVFAALGLRRATEAVIEPAAVATADLFAPSNDIVAFAPPFGALPAKALAEAVAACRQAGASDLRLTPWRVLLATGVGDRAGLSARLARSDFILDPQDPRLNVTTCVGAPACHRATTPTRSDAALLAERLGRDLEGILHVSGCAKGCGRPPSAPWALIAREGRYDLFGQGEPAPRVTGLSSTEAANWLSRAGRPRIS